MTSREAFKFGFFARCAAEGLTPEQTADLAVKTAAIMEKQAILGMDTAGEVAKSLGSYALPAALIAPPVAGGLAAYGLHRMTDINDEDVHDVKDNEVMDEYSRQAQRLRRAQALRALAPPSHTRGRPLMR